MTLETQNLCRVALEKGPSSTHQSGSEESEFDDAKCMTAAETLLRVPRPDILVPVGSHIYSGLDCPRVQLVHKSPSPLPHSQFSLRLCCLRIVASLGGCYPQRHIDGHE